jgi:MFS family permease
MSIFSIVALAGNGFGPLIGGWIEMNPRLEWRWIQWIQLMCVPPPFYFSAVENSFLFETIAQLWWDIRYSHSFHPPRNAFDNRHHQDRQALEEENWR